MLKIPKKHELILLILPMISVYSTTALCKIDKSSGVNVKFRPPAKFFGINIYIFIVALQPPSSGPCPDDPKRSVKVLCSNRDCETDCLDDVPLLENIA